MTTTAIRRRGAEEKEEIEEKKIKYERDGGENERV